MNKFERKEVLDKLASTRTVKASIVYFRHKGPTFEEQMWFHNYFPPDKLNNAIRFYNRKINQNLEAEMKFIDLPAKYFIDYNQPLEKQLFE